MNFLKDLRSETKIFLVVGIVAVIVVVGAILLLKTLQSPQPSFSTAYKAQLQVVDVITDTPISNAQLRLEELIACPAVVGAECESRSWTLYTDKNGKTELQLSEPTTVSITIEREGYVKTTDAFTLEEKDKPLVKKFSLLPIESAIQSAEDAWNIAKEDTRVQEWLRNHTIPEPQQPSTFDNGKTWVVSIQEFVPCADSQGTSFCLGDVLTITLDTFTGKITDIEKLEKGIDTSAWQTYRDDVRVLLDKSEYEYPNTIEATLYHDMEETIIGFFELQRKEEEKWRKAEFGNAKFWQLQVAPASHTTREAIEFSVDTKASSPFPEGTYRLVFIKYPVDENSGVQESLGASEEFPLSYPNAAFEEFCGEGMLPFEVTRARFDDERAEKVFVYCASSENPFFDYKAYLLNGTSPDSPLQWRWLAYMQGAPRTVSKPRLVDVDSDGFYEIYWTQGDHGGTCTCYSSDATIYSFQRNEAFSLSRGGCFNNQCKYVVENPFRFSENLHNTKYPSKEYAFKRYLLEKSAEGREKYVDLSSGIGIAFPNGWEALTLGEQYYISVVTDLDDREFVRKTGEIGVALYKGEERLGFILDGRIGEVTFGWKAGEYKTSAEGEVKVALPGDDYRIQLYSVGDLEDFSDNFFVLTNEQ